MIVLDLAIYIRLNLVLEPHVGLEYIIYFNGQLDSMTK